MLLIIDIQFKKKDVEGLLYNGYNSTGHSLGYGRQLKAYP
jgi:hypothetical protein